MAHGLDGTISLANFGYGTIGQGAIGDPTDGQVFTDAQIAAAIADPAHNFPAPIIEWSPTTGPHETPVWEDITDLIRAGTTGHGRASERDGTQAGKISLLAENHLRTFDPTVNPGCRPRRRIRGRVGRGNSYLRTTGASFSGAWTQDHPTLDITGAITMRCRVALDDWTPAAVSILMAKMYFTAGQGSYGFGVDTAGRLVFNYSTDGTVPGLLFHTSTAATGAANGATLWVQVTLEFVGPNRVVKFWTSAANTNDHTAVTWTQLGSTVTVAGATPMHSGQSVLAVGALPDNNSLMAGRTYAAAILDSSGAVATAVDFTDPAQFAPGAYQGVDATGKVWHISSPATLTANIKPLWSGYLDGLPQDYDDHGTDPLVRLTATDGFWLAQQYDMQGAYPEIVRADNPSGWWRLDDVNRTEHPICADSSGNGHDGVYRGRPSTADEALISDGGQALVFDADNNDKVWIDPAANIVTAPFSVEAWVRSGTVTGPNKTAEIVCQSYDSGALGGSLTGGFKLNDPLYGKLNDPAATLQAGGETFAPGFGWGLGFELAQQAGTNYPLFSFTCDAGTTTVAVGTQSIAAQTAVDDNTHHLVGTVGFDRKARLYVDGVLVATAPSAVSTPVIAGGGTTGRIRFASPPTLPDDTTYRRWNGTLDDISIYPTALTPDQVLAHYRAGVDGWEGDLPGERLDRMLDIIDWPDDDRDLDPGASVLQGDVGEQSVLAHMQAVNETEQGRMFVTADGKWRLIGRHAELTDPRSLNVQAEFTSDASDYDALSFDYGAQTLVNDAKVTPRNGTEQREIDQASIDEYGRQSLRVSGTLQSSAEARGLAQWVLMHYADPLLRVASLTVIPQRDETVLFPALFDLEVGDRVAVTLTRDGPDISIECLVEGISHRFGRKELWTSELRLSPANTLTGFFILNDPAVGRLGTGLLAY